ncbi:uncharacterized protein [Solanum tuberosum]|uniref:Uncharacterized protein n=1 Tax=Solanum tuberosum TaxID=4113 RepID=M1D062_SOLTU|nr:PREDICTED: uncharacterized protein LOC102581171 [Solanum tuberosum]KAH0671936.1 hypothetical protein KY284_023023 [Solanum tuberosum]
MLSSPLKSVVGSLPTVSEPNGSQPRSAPSLAMLKLNKTIFSPLQLTGNGKELPRQETTSTAVSRRELVGLAATTLGGLALLAAEPAEALEVADIGDSIKELFGFFKGKPKTGADNEKKPNSGTDDKKPKMEGHGNKPKIEADEKKSKVENHGNKPKVEVDEKKTKNGDDTKASAPHHSEKEKVSSSSAAALSLPNILNNIVP